jgi:hypothetical protein
MQIDASRHSSLYLLIGFLLMLSVSGCGEGHTATANPSGIFVDSTTETFFKTSFDEVKICTDSKEGKFEDISIVVMPPTFPCRYYAAGCAGEYVTPNSIKVGSLNTWRHEVIHYLLNQNTGDPDPDHKSPFFQSCV